VAIDTAGPRPGREVACARGSWATEVPGAKDDHRVEHVRRNALTFANHLIVDGDSRNYWPESILSLF